MIFEINKKPEFENDSYLITLKDFILTDEILKKILDNNPYINLKYKKFKNKDISKNGFEEFLQSRGSLRFFNSIRKLYGSIYTYSVTDRNNISYTDVLDLVKQILHKNPNSRKAVVRMVNSITEYYTSEFNNLDVSCLNLIHYLNNKVNLVFRSSDIQYELFADIVTIYWFFMKPIYNDKKIDIQIYGSTGQNINYLEELKYKLIEECV